QGSDPCPLDRATLKVGALHEVHENDPYLMASSKLRRTGSFGVPTRSRGFSPPSWSFAVLSQRSGWSTSSRTKSSMEGNELGAGFLFGMLIGVLYLGQRLCNVRLL